MVARVSTVAFVGIEARPVDVQVDVSPGFIGFTVVGLPDKAVGESRERVRAALLASGLSLPAKRITVNLAPADLPKEGSHYDLPIALGLMAATGAIPRDALDGIVALGELALDGRISAVTGVLPAAIAAAAAGQRLVCPQSCGAEAAWAGDDLEIAAAPTLLSLVNHLNGVQQLARPRPATRLETMDLPDLADVRGQETARRALEVAAAGAHNMIMTGPPGAGKSMLAQRLPSLLPPLSARELLEVSMIASVAGELPEGALTDRRPFRAPHHSASMVSLVGGGLRARPGEVSLAHNGVLFLDELPEFVPFVLDALRQPLENAEVTITRANYRVSFPARFQLIAAMNPCRCGRFGEPGYACRKGRSCDTEYQSRISGPFLDRMDIMIEVPAVRATDLLSRAPGEASKPVAARVREARQRQVERYAAMGVDVRTNGSAPHKVIEEAARTDAAGLSLLSDAANRFGLTARGLTRTLRVARTLADLEGAPTVKRIHIAEALAYRFLVDRKPQAA